MIPRLYWPGHYLLRDGEGGFEYLQLSMILFYFKEKEKARGELVIYFMRTICL